MITFVHGRQCIVGAACNVYGSSPAEQKSIAKDLKLKENGKSIWRLPAVQKRFKDEIAFKEHWNAAYECVRWRCPVTHYHWLREPMPFDPDEVAPRDPPRKKVIAMHDSYQSIRPERAFALLEKHLPAHHPILGWLSNGEFDILQGGKTSSVSNKARTNASASTPIDPFCYYLQENEVVVTPRHHLLQEAFTKYLVREKATAIEPNIERVDIRFKLSGRGHVLAEIKPTETGTVRYAIRCAMGQLLDYRQKCGKKVRLLVVISGKPEDKDDLALALDNGFGLAWQTKNGFDVSWPT